MHKIAKVDELSRAEWLEYRQRGIGGSDAGAIAGLNPWKSAFSVYLDKVSDQVREIEDNERMRIGRDLEDYVAKRFEEETGKKVRRNNFMLQHPEHPWMYANLDREIVGEKAILECKTTGSYSKKEWEEGIPPHYELQCLHYLAVTGYDTAYIACLIGNEKFIWHKIDRDEDMINNLIQIEKRFWDNTQNGVMPSPDGSSDYDKALLDKFNKPIDDYIELETDSELLDSLSHYKDLKKDIDTKIKALEQTIKLHLGDNIKGISDAYEVTWKVQESSRLDTTRLKAELPDIADKYMKTSSTRVLRIKNKK